MNYSVHDTEAEAQAENDRLETLMGIPQPGTALYDTPELFDGKWRIRTKETGTWKCDHLAVNVQFMADSEQQPPEEPEPE